MIKPIKLDSIDTIDQLRLAKLQNEVEIHAHQSHYNVIRVSLLCFNAE